MTLFFIRETGGNSPFFSFSLLILETGGNFFQEVTRLSFSVLSVLRNKGTYLFFIVSFEKEGQSIYFQEGKSPMQAVVEAWRPMRTPMLAKQHREEHLMSPSEHGAARGRGKEKFHHSSANFPASPCFSSYICLALFLCRNGVNTFSRSGAFQSGKRGWRFQERQT